MIYMFLSNNPSSEDINSSNLSCSERIHVAYQINRNEAYNNMQVNILPLHIQMTPGVGSKEQNIFCGLVAYP